MYNKVYQGSAYHTLLSQVTAESVDLVYIDPPFFSQRTLRKRKSGHKFEDSWDSIDDYTRFIDPILRQLKDKLKPTGVICVHLDFRAVHYVKCSMDKMFPKFINEIIWNHDRWNPNPFTFLNSHDTILVYGKNKKYTFNRPNKQYRSARAEFDFQRGYTTRSGDSRYYPDGKSTRIVIAYDINKVNEAIKKGILVKGKNYDKIVETRSSGYRVESDVWNINILGNSCSENAEYPTQKPLKLLEKIIRAFSNKGDLVLDCFAGSGTTLVAADKLQRKYIGIDNNPDAIKTIKSRLKDYTLEMF